MKISEYKLEYDKFMEMKGLSKEYRSTTRTSFNQLIIFAGDIELKALTQKIVYDFVYATFQRSKHAARTYKLALRSAFKEAHGKGYVSENHFLNIPLVKIPVNYPAFLTREDFYTLIKDESNLMLRNLYVFAFNTGARLSEITNLTWNSIDFNNRIVSLGNSSSFVNKSRKEREIPMNDMLYKVLKFMWDELYNACKIHSHPIVFCKPDGSKYNEDYVSRKFKRLTILTFVDPRIHFHSLRHSFASNLVSNGAPLEVVKELMGHSDLSLTLIYARLDRKPKINAVKLLDTYVNYYPDGSTSDPEEDYVYFYEE